MSAPTKTFGVLERCLHKSLFTGLWGNLWRAHFYVHKQAPKHIFPAIVWLARVWCGPFDYKKDRSWKKYEGWMTVICREKKSNSLLISNVPKCIVYLILLVQIQFHTSVTTFCFFFCIAVSFLTCSCGFLYPNYLLKLAFWKFQGK